MIYRTMADQKKACFTWTVKGFDMCPHLHRESVESPEFRVGSYKFILQLYPKGFGRPDYITVYLKRLRDCGATEVSVTFKISFLCDEGRHTCSFKNWIVLQECRLGRKAFVEANRVLSIQKKKFIPNDNLTIECEVSVNDNKQFCGKFCNVIDSESLSRDFAKILGDGIHSDLTLVVGEEKFKVHRAILECRCPRLTSQMKETDIANEYSLIDIETSALRTLLGYLYTGSFKVSNAYEEIVRFYSFPELKNSVGDPYIINIRASTEINVSRLSFRWIITDFSKLNLNEERIYPAFLYSTHEWSKLEIILTVLKSENGSSTMQLKFIKLSSDVKPLIRCKISICRNIDSVDGVTATTQYYHVAEYEHLFEGKTWITPLGSEIELDDVLFDDTLNMFFGISLSNKEVYSKIEQISVENRTRNTGDTIEIVESFKLLQEDLQNLYRNPRFSDAKLCVEDEVYHVHKSVLCGRSRVFASMFEHDTLEKREGVVTIEDLDSSTVSSMLRYIYCGYIGDVSFSEATLIYAAADKYELLDLKNNCASFLKSHMNAEHVGEILLLADAHHDENLKKSVYDFMASNPQQVLNSENALSILKNRLDVYPDILNGLLKRVISLREGTEFSSDS